MRKSFLEEPFSHKIMNPSSQEQVPCPVLDSYKEPIGLLNNIHFYKF